uniref:Thioredoxin domain-containing protein n=1 Tax=Caenorhabditis japonica TaxID=281687 RepID=A0A8R1HQN3_CAEJA
MPVTAVRTLYELTDVMDRADANRLIIVDFYAVWCGPCRHISPIFEQMSAEFGNATFLKVDVDQSRDISSRYGITAMPTFLFFKNKALVDTVRGANEHAIRSTIQKHYSTTPANPNSASDDEKRFLEQFVRHTGRRNYYTDEVFKALARSVMPEEELLLKSKNEKGEVDEMELLRNLMDWFKNDFFTWFDSPTCEKCTLKASGGLAGTPTKNEQEDGASRVEIFICNGCNSEMRFPRYNNPAKLLQTRTGRCGEWANCFALMLSAIGLESRYIFDTTDHVWNEVFINSENRWIHVDPCENILDRPLLYTKGWSKQLSYCIAYGNDHVSDVTWRYVYDAKLTAQRRYEVRPAVFENFLAKLNARQMEGCSDERKKTLAVRRAVDLIEMAVANEKYQKIGWEKLGDDLGGRTTGGCF